MWFCFAQCAMACVALLLIPGFAIMRALSFRRAESLLLSPIVSIATLEMLSILFACAKIELRASTLLAALALLLAAFSILKKLFLGNRNEACCFLPSGSTRESAVTLVIYMSVALVLTVLFFILPLDGPDSFNQDHDNVFHLNLIQTFAQSGNMSPLGVSVYANADYPPYETSGAFYPAAWHMLAALSSSLVGADAPIAANAMNATILLLVLPFSFCAFMRSLFGTNEGLIRIGALCFMAFWPFPWSFLTFGPLYPNLLGMSLCPMFLALLISLISKRDKGKQETALALVLTSIGLFALLFAHANAVFSAGVILFPYLALQVFKRKPSSRWRILRNDYARLLLFLCIATCIWVIAFRSPFMSGVVSFNWPATTTFVDALVQAMTGSFNGVTQTGIAIVVFYGFVASLSKKDLSWLSLSGLLTITLFAIASGSDGALKQFLTGFWYTDPYRLAAMAVLCAIPLMAVGLDSLYHSLRKQTGGVTAAALAPASILLVFAIVTYWPTYDPDSSPNQHSAFALIRDKLEKLNDASIPNIVDPEERLFMEEVREITGDSLVLNNPEDGSFFAYPISGLNVYYRSSGLTNDSTLTPESYLIKNNLHRFSQSKAVQLAIDNIGAEFVMLLDMGGQITAERHTYGYYDPQEWAGLNQIDDATPGFEVILSKGDMRLYKIVR